MSEKKYQFFFKLLCSFFQPPPPLFLALNLDRFACCELSKKINWIRCPHLICIHDISLKIAMKDLEKIRALDSGLTPWFLFYLMLPWEILSSWLLSFTISWYCLFWSRLPPWFLNFWFALCMSACIRLRSITINDVTQLVLLLPLLLNMDSFLNASFYLPSLGLCRMFWV